MANRKTQMVLRCPVTEEERKLIEEKMAQLPTKQIGAYLWKMVIDGCVIQINTDDRFVSNLPYLHVFDKLESVHHQMDETELITSMKDIEYRLIDTTKQELPNGKKLVQLDFQR